MTFYFYTNERTSEIMRGVQSPKERADNSKVTTQDIEKVGLGAM